MRIERSAPPGSKSKTWPILISVILLAGIGTAVWFLRKPAAVEVRTVPARELSKSNGTGAADRTVLNGSGYVTARRQATVSSKITGKVTEVLIEEGMQVKEGQVLAKLDDTNIKASLLLAEAQLKSSRAALAETEVRIKEAEQELKRQSDLVTNNIATKADYDHAEAAAFALKARLEQQKADIVVAERNLATWQQQLDDAVIHAPFSGIVTAKNAQPGEMISPMSAGGAGSFTRTGIGTVVDMESLEIEVDVSESYINRVQPSQPVEATLDAYPEWKIPCKVIAIIPTADRQKSTVKVRVGFDKLDPKILPEMSVKVAFHESAVTSNQPQSGPHGVTVPKSALQQADGKDVVLVVQNGRAERRAVTVASVGPDEAVIIAGLTVGERIITDAPATLSDGSRVKEMKP